MAEGQENVTASNTNTSGASGSGNSSSEAQEKNLGVESLANSKEQGKSKDKNENMIMAFVQLIMSSLGLNPEQKQHTETAVEAAQAGATPDTASVQAETMKQAKNVSPDVIELARKSGFREAVASESMAHADHSLKQAPTIGTQQQQSALSVA